MTGMACLSPRGLALEVGGALRAQHVALGPNPGSKSGIGEAQPSLRPLDCPWVWNETGKAWGGCISPLHSCSVRSPPHLPPSPLASPTLTHRLTQTPRPSRTIAASRKGGKWEGTQGCRVEETPPKDHTPSW